MSTTKGRNMPWENLGDQNIWDLLFEQTPTPLRYLFGVMSLGAFTAATAWWRAHKRRIERLETKIEKETANLYQRIEKSNGEVREEVRDVSSRLDEMNNHLVQIAINTNGSHQSNDRT